MHLFSCDRFGITFAIRNPESDNNVVYLVFPAIAFDIDSLSSSVKEHQCVKPKNSVAYFCHDRTLPQTSPSNEGNMLGVVNIKV